MRVIRDFITFSSETVENIEDLPETISRDIANHCENGVDGLCLTKEVLCLELALLFVEPTHNSFKGLPSFNFLFLRGNRTVEIPVEMKWPGVKSEFGSKFRREAC